MDEASAQASAGWRYDEPYGLYNPGVDETDEVVQGFLDPANGYYAVSDAQGELVAYCCFGPDARVPGGDYEADALDVGMGTRPDLTGQGCGHALIMAVLDQGQREFEPRAFRATVAAFNTRALRLCERAGLRPVQTFQRASDGRAFTILIREE